eukprot:137526-Rhodomonas_salina.1
MSKSTALYAHSCPADWNASMTSARSARLPSSSARMKLYTRSSFVSESSVHSTEICASGILSIKPVA